MKREEGEEEKEEEGKEEQQEEEEEEGDKEEEEGEGAYLTCVLLSQLHVLAKLSQALARGRSDLFLSPLVQVLPDPSFVLTVAGDFSSSPPGSPHRLGVFPDPTAPFCQWEASRRDTASMSMTT